MADEVVKAYRNVEFLNSREARTIRVVCEFEETRRRLRAQNVKETIMVFGSARARTHEQHAKELSEATAKLNDPATSPEDKKKAEVVVDRLTKGQWMCDLVESVAELSRQLTEWAMQYKSTEVVGGGFLATGNDETDESEGEEDEEEGEGEGEEGGRPRKRRKTHHKQSLMICTGGGPGLMEAANRGAAMVPNSKNIGMKITLPFEQKHNPHVTKGLCFQYHYFFTRKYWMLFPCRALIVAPGGFGTMDELFELLTLKQSGKIKADIPIVLFGKDYWNSTLRLDAAVKFGTVSRAAVDALLVTDSVEEAFEFVTKGILVLRGHD